MRVVVALAAAGAAGCLTGENLSLGHDVDASSQTPPPATVEGGSTPVQDESLGAAIEAPTGTICAGQCVPLRAVATGGEGSYTYAWDDDAGVGEGPNTVCPLTTTTYFVVVNSAESELGATASLTIAVVPCDAGASGSAPDSEAPSQMSNSQDAETAPVEGLCLTNPSFEGATVTDPVTPGVPATGVPTGWVACTGDPTVDPTLSPLPAETGKSFVGLPVGSGMFADVTASLGTTLCATLEPGVEYSFCIGVGVAFTGAVPQDAPAPTLQLWGASSPCDQAQGELLWASGPISNTDAWTKVCPNFFATQAITNIVLVPTVPATTGEGLLSYVIIDDIVGP